MENGMGAAVDAATEAKALGKVVEALVGLDSEATRRVLEWAWKRYVGTTAPEPRRRSKSGEPPGDVDTPDGGENADLGELYDAAKPTTDAEKVLVVAYWHQVVQKKETLDSQTLNSDLKDLGHGVGNVTAACSALMNTQPALMRQVKKKGTTQQSRKLYRVTSAGVQRVQEMVGHGGQEGR